nr:unnamed protein product [Callosobruchus chinensis]
MSNRPISVAELDRRRLATAASLSKDLEAITAWGLRNMVEFNASKTQYCTLSNKRCPSGHSVLMNNQALPRSHSFKLLGVSITENMIWHEHVSSIATAAGKKLGYLFRARTYFSPSNLLTLYKAQIRPSLEYCSHIWGAAAPTTLSILDTVQRRAIRLIGDPALTCHLQPLSHRRAENESTQDAIADVMKSVYNSLNLGNPSACVFVDVKKAFDTVQHQAMLVTLENLGFRGNALALLKSYLSDRYQCVKVNDTISDIYHITYGIPQGIPVFDGDTPLS